VAKSKKMRVAVYAGSFDPTTNGHLKIVKRALHLFDKLIIAVGISGSKSTLFTIQERLAMLEAACGKWDGVTIKSYDGLTVDFARSEGACALVRGLRSGEDFTYEMAMAQMNRHLAGNIETLFIPTNPEFFHISSTLVKDVAKHQGDFSSLVPPAVAKKLKEKFQ
jgi:pantetheine-phosphate adenylyltransferase